MMKHVLTNKALIATLALALSGCYGKSSDREPSPVPEITQSPNWVQSGSVDLNGTVDAEIGQGLFSLGNTQYVAATSGSNLVIAAVTDAGLETLYEIDFEAASFVTHDTLPDANDASISFNAKPIHVASNLDASAFYVTLDSGELIAFEFSSDPKKSNIKLLWTYNLKSLAVALPVVYSDSIYIKTLDNSLHAVASDTGQKTWLASVQPPILSTWGGSAPVVSEEVIVAGFDDGVVRVYERLEGQFIWQRHFVKELGRSELERLEDIDSPPLMVGRNLYVANYPRVLTAYNLAERSELWQTNHHITLPMQYDANKLYFVDDADRVTALQRQSGAVAWTTGLLKYRTLTAPMMWSNISGDIYQNAPNRFLVVGDQDGYIYLLDTQDGKIAAADDVSGNPVIDIMPMDDALLVLDQSGFLQHLSIRGDL